MTRNRRSAWRNRLAVVATVFAALAALSTTKAEAVVPSVSVFNVHMAEGNVGQKLMPFSIKLSIPSPAPQWVKVQTVSSGGSPAEGGKDYQVIALSTIQFPPNVTSKVFYTTILGDTVDEYDETMSVKVIGHSAGINVADGEGVGSITDDDAAPVVTVNDVSKNEGTGAITPFTFSAKLSAASEKPIKVSAVGQSGTAHVPEDLTAGPVTLSFAPGQTVRTYTAHVNGDGNLEPNETFTAKLGNPINVAIADGTGVGTVVNDDFLVANPQPQPQPNPQPQPQPQPQPNPQPNAGVEAEVTDSAPLAEGEQALGPNAVAEARPASKAMDWSVAGLLTLLGMCLAGLLVVGVIIARRGKEDERTA